MSVWNIHTLEIVASFQQRPYLMRCSPPQAHWLCDIELQILVIAPCDHALYQSPHIRAWTDMEGNYNQPGVQKSTTGSLWWWRFCWNAAICCSRQSFCLSGFLCKASDEPEFIHTLPLLISAGCTSAAMPRMKVLLCACSDWAVLTQFDQLPMPRLLLSRPSTIPANRSDERAVFCTSSKPYTIMARFGWLLIIAENIKSHL